MSSTMEQHPSEECLADVVTGDAPAEVMDHVKACAECSRAIEDLRALTKGLAGLDEEDVPEALSRSILEIPQRRKSLIRPKTQTKPWIPFWVLMGLGFALLALFLYYFFSQLA